LCGIPLAESTVEAELTTPTGAAILATLVDSFGPLPAMTVRRIGCGAGTRELADQPNLLRLLVGSAGDVADEVAADADAATRLGATLLDATTGDTLWIVETNLDDATGETIGYALDRLWQAGAVDVYTTPIAMKKHRPGVLVSVMCPAERVAAIERVLLSETTTLGVRRYQVQRRMLRREPCRVETPWGPADGVVAHLGGGQRRFSPEYESCRRIAAEHNVPLQSVYRAAEAAFGEP
jgi:hypothetical protein